MNRIAMMTTGPFKQGVSQAGIEQFSTLSNRIFAQAQQAKGLLAMTASMNAPETPDEWGAWAFPTLYAEEAKTVPMLQTFSIWENLEAMVAYSYHGVHKEGIQRSNEWFAEIPIPNHVIWWLADGEQPTWADGAQRYDRLSTEGASVTGFNMRKLFDAEGKETKLNRELVKQYAANFE